jgi:hypothetical protein
MYIEIQPPSFKAFITNDLIAVRVFSRHKMFSRWKATIDTTRTKTAYSKAIVGYESRKK